MLSNYPSKSRVIRAHAYTYKPTGLGYVENYSLKKVIWQRLSQVSYYAQLWPPGQPNCGAMHARIFQRFLYTMMDRLI